MANFGEAIEALKQGKKVTRGIWGISQHLWLKPATEVQASWCKDPMLKELAEKNGGSIPAAGTICLYTYAPIRGNMIISGWVPTQIDMLSEDWMILN